MVTFDCGSLDRLGDLEPAAKAARELVVVDHHISNDRYGTINVIDPDGGRERVLVRRLIDRARPPAQPRRRGLPLRRARVRHRPLPVRDDDARGVRARARELVELRRARSRRCRRTLFEEHRFAYLQAARRGARRRGARAASSAFVWTAVTQADLAGTTSRSKRSRASSTSCAAPREAEVACVLKEEPDGTVRVSLRSLGAVDVRTIAEAHGGGGHRFAAGFTSTTAIADDRRPHRAPRSEPATAVTSTGWSSSTSRPGWTSHDVVAKLRKVYGQRRVGHAGTLDPDATGVLLVGLGRVDAAAALPAGDGEGVPRHGRVRRRDRHARRGGRGARPATDAGRRRSRSRPRRARFVGDIEQVPPMVSAIKVGGRRLHELARAGEEVERAPRRVRIDRFDVEEFEPGPYPRGRRSWSSARSGTYIRSLAADLGAALGGRAHLAALRRLRVGSFTLDEARPLEAIEADPTAAVLTPVDAMRGLERVDVDAEQAARGRARRRRSRRPCSPATRRARPVRGRRRPTARCSRSTSGAARASKPAVVLAAGRGDA